MSNYKNVSLDLFFTVMLTAGFIATIITLTVVLSEIRTLKQPCTEQTK